MMMKKSVFIRSIFLLILIASFLIGCGGTENLPVPKLPTSSQNEETPKEKRATLHTFLQPENSGELLHENSNVSLDASNACHGYFMVKYSGSSDKARLQITNPDDIIYTYALKPGAYETIPFTGGNGSYHVDVLEHAYDELYALALSCDVDCALSDEFEPYLYPNQYVWFSPDSDATAFGISLSDNSSSDLDYLEQVYYYVIQNIAYDTELAANIPLNYIPDIDRTLEIQKGICFDYASLMTALLRSQGIPTKLVVGYSGTAYHAWISVYLSETGWVDGIIQFDGESWSLMDPTLAANNSSSSVGKYIGDGSNYLAKYFY